MTINSNRTMEAMYKLAPVWKNLINIGPLTKPRDVPSRPSFSCSSSLSSSSSSSVPPPLASGVRLCQINFVIINFYFLFLFRCYYNVTYIFIFLLTLLLAEENFRLIIILFSKDESSISFSDATSTLYSG